MSESRDPTDRKYSRITSRQQKREEESKKISIFLE